MGGGPARARFRRDDAPGPGRDAGEHARGDPWHRRVHGPGDIGVVQYSGHGTQVADTDGDEMRDHLDEALVPVDFGTGSFIIDDDLRSIFATIRTGASITCFMDCCFSETNTRLLRVEQPRLGMTGATARFLPRSAALDRQYRRFRADLPTSGSGGGSATTPLTHVSFSACRDFQVALESDGHGHFTAAAAGLLRDPEALSWTNVEFFQRILGTIEPGQTPTLEPAGDSRRVLASYAAAADVGLPSPRRRSANGRAGLPRSHRARLIEPVVERAPAGLTPADWDGPGRRSAVHDGGPGGGDGGEPLGEASVHRQRLLRAPRVGAGRRRERNGDDRDVEARRREGDEAVRFEEHRLGKALLRSLVVAEDGLLVVGDAVHDEAHAFRRESARPTSRRATRPARSLPIALGRSPRRR